MSQTPKGNPAEANSSPWRGLQGRFWAASYRTVTEPDSSADP